MSKWFSYVASTYMYILLRRANYLSYFANGHTHLDIIYMIPYYTVIDT